MGRQFQAEYRLSLPIGSPAIVAINDIGSRLQLAVIFQIADTGHLAVEHYIHIHGLIIEVLYYKRLVVVREQGYLGTTFNIVTHVTAHTAANDVQRPGWIIVEVAKIIRNGEHV